MKYQLKQSPGFKRSIKKIKEKPLQNKIKNALYEIQADPYGAGEKKSGDLSGVFCYDIKHVKVSYELAYMIEVNESGGIVVVLLAGTRENFYNELRKYIRAFPK